MKKKAGYPALPGMALESMITGILDGAIFGAGTLMPALWSLVPATPEPMAVTSQPREGFLMVFAGVLTAIPLLLYSAANQPRVHGGHRLPAVVSPTIALMSAESVLHRRQMELAER